MQRSLAGLAMASAMFAGALLAAQEPGPQAAFDVQLTLSPQAQRVLKKTHEGIVVLASYYAEPNTAGERHVDQIGRIDMGQQKLILPGEPGTVHISGDLFARHHLGWTRGPVMLNVNVYSARRAGPDNILACDFFDGELGHATAVPMELHCYLIDENREIVARK